MNLKTSYQTFPKVTKKNVTHEEDHDEHEDTETELENGDECNIHEEEYNKFFYKQKQQTKRSHRRCMHGRNSQSTAYDDDEDDEYQNYDYGSRMIPRLVKRNLPHYQSKQVLSVENHTTLSRLRGLTWNLYFGYDWFHVVLRWPTLLSVLLLVLTWTIMVAVFALIYQKLDNDFYIDEECGLGSGGNPIDFAGAFAFSLETCTTVGYSLPGGDNNAFFEHCPKLQTVLYFEMVFSMLFNAFLFSFFFARLSRPETRGSQVLFSNKAIIEYRNGKWLFHARIYDLDASRPLVEVHVRLYAVSWKAYERQVEKDVQPHLLYTMRLLHPNDELGAMLFTSIPATITHHIDAYSPLVPPYLRDQTNLVKKNGLALREVDRMVESNGGIPCPVCGENFGNYRNLRRHIKYSKLMEGADDKVPIIGSHQDPALILPHHTKPFELTEDIIRDSLRDKEIICVCEGVEPLVSGTFLAMQSYKFEDIVFGGRYSSCMMQRDGKIIVDLDRFHEITPSASSSGRVSSTTSLEFLRGGGMKGKTKAWTSLSFFPKSWFS